MPEREKTDLHNEWTAADLEKIAAIEQTRQRNFAANRHLQPIPPTRLPVLSPPT